MSRIVTSADLTPARGLPLTPPPAELPSLEERRHDPPQPNPATTPIADAVVFGATCPQCRRLVEWVGRRIATTSDAIPCCQWCRPGVDAIELAKAG